MENPISSREVRWFFSGPVSQPPEVVAWFESTAPFPKSKNVPRPNWTTRDNNEPDVYLLIPHQHDMGLKWREGSFQIKGRVESLAIESFGPAAHGHTERWLKWSYEKLPSNYQKIFQADDASERALISVSKNRLLRVVELTDAGQGREIDPEHRVDRVMQIELTEVVVQDQQYYTLSFEASPDDAVSAKHFVRLVEKFLIDLPKNLELTLENSKAYPAFLSSLAD